MTVAVNNNKTKRRRKWKYRIHALLGTRWSEQSASCPDHLIPAEKAPLNRMLGRPQSQFGHMEKRKTLFLTGIEHQFPGHPTCSLVTILTVLFWLPAAVKYSDCNRKVQKLGDFLCSCQPVQAYTDCLLQM